MEKIHVRDAVYDEIPVYRDIEEHIINRWEVQRLRYIKQLQLAYLVYPSAVHTRFEHSLGVMHVASEFLDHLVESADNLEYLKKAANLPLVSDSGFAKLNRVVSRIAGLLHDAGHGPLGHIFDEYVVPTVLSNYGDLLIERCFSHEVLSFLIYWHRLRDDIGRALERVSELKKYVSDIIDWLDQVMIPICRDPQTGKSIYHSEFKVEPCGYGYLIRMIVRDHLYPADLMDFLLRDSKFTGAIELGTINRLRLMRYTKPVPSEEVVSKIPFEEASRERELFKSLPTPVLMVLDERALADLIRFLDARKLMYENVYLHKAIRAFGWSAIEILSNEEVWHHIGFSKSLLPRVLRKPRDQELVNAFLDEYLELTDYVLLKARDLVRRGVIREVSIGNHVRALFDHRKPLYKSIHSELVPAAPYLSVNSKAQARMRKYEEELRKGIVERVGSSSLYEYVRVGIEQIQIYPGTAWNVQGPGIYTVVDGSMRVYTIEEFSKRYHLSNLGIIRLYIDRSLESDVSRKLHSLFVKEVKDNVERREELSNLIGLTTISTITM